MGNRRQWQANFRKHGWTVFPHRWRGYKIAEACSCYLRSHSLRHLRYIGHPLSNQIRRSHQCRPRDIPVQRWCIEHVHLGLETKLDPVLDSLNFIGAIHHSRTSDQNACRERLPHYYLRNHASCLSHMDSDRQIWWGGGNVHDNGLRPTDKRTCEVPQDSDNHLIQCILSALLLLKCWTQENHKYESFRFWSTREKRKSTGNGRRKETTFKFNGRSYSQ